jgi:HK97 family phage prohead protease
MPDQIERKFIPLSELKMSDEGPGTIEGYRAVFGEIDRQGDITIKGAFVDGHDEYMHSGFSAHSHIWDFKDAVGYPVEAYEDEHGWFVKSEFHTTQGAQDVRTIARERMKAGKQVGFSFGYGTDDFQFIEQKDFKDQLPQFIKADRLEANMKIAQKFSRIRILKKVTAIEDSLVTRPANPLTSATAVKSGNKGMLAEEMAQSVPSVWDLERAMHNVVRKIAETAKASKVTDVPIDIQAKVSELIAEYAPQLPPLIINQINEFLESSDDEFYLKGITGTESFESFESAGAALAKFAEKMRSNHEIRVKEGRVLSTSNRAKVQACKEAMSVLIADLDDLLTLSEPKPKEKGIDVAALRIHSDRVRNRLMSRLAQ